MDRYEKPEENLQAIHHVLEARRTELRHGTLHLVRATMTGFKALPAPPGAKPKRPWWAVMGWTGPVSEKSLIEARYKELAKTRHPDTGGSEVAMAELNRRCVVLRGKDDNALWVTSWPFAEYVRHAWAGAWVNSLFRNEGAGLSSELILQAVAATKSIWTPPDMGLITFVDAAKTRHKRDPGRCYRKAGFSHVGFTKGGLWAFQLLPEKMPPAAPPYTNQPSLFELEAA